MPVSILVPVGHGNGQRAGRANHLAIAGVYTIGTVVAALAVGLAIGAIADLAARGGIEARREVRWLALGISVLYLPRLLGLTHRPPLLESRWQVPRRWMMQLSAPATALAYGLGLGSGLSTRIVVPTLYLLVLWPFLVPGMALALALWAVYGVARTLNVWWLAMSAPPGDLLEPANDFLSRMLNRGQGMRRWNAVLLAAVAVWLAGSSHLG